MKKNTIKIFNILLIPFKICLVLAISYGIYDYFNDVFLHDDVDYGHSYKSLPENSMDVIVLGSSHAQYSFNPSFFYKDTGLYSYVLGSPCQPLEVSYEMLKEALKTQSPQMIVLEVYTALPLRSICEADSAYVIAQYQMTGDEKYNTIDYLEEEKAKTYYNDFLSLHNNWVNIEGVEDLMPKIPTNENYADINPTFGYIPLEQTLIDNSWYPAKFDQFNDVELDELDLESLNNIYRLCEEHEIELLLYKTPIDSMDVENHSYLNEVWSWASEKNIKYINFFELAEELDFKMWIESDSYHAYINGAEIITTEIGNFINENYDIQNNRINESLNKIYNKSSNYYILKYLQDENDPNKYLDRLASYENLIVIKFSSENGSADVTYNKMLKVFGIENFDIENDLYIIIDKGEIITSSNYDFEFNHNDNNITIINNILNINDINIELPNGFGIVVVNENMDNYVIKDIHSK